MERHYSLLDKIIIEIDKGLTTLIADVNATRPNPADRVTTDDLTTTEQRHGARLMRVNHSGEVCAQALYRGQLVFARHADTQQMMQQAAVEEVDHLAWTHERIQTLKGHRSLLNGFWYLNSFMIGMLVAKFGDDYSLGFIEETEIQVGKHLQSHLGKLPAADEKSRAIVAQMQADELAHSDAAKSAGGKDLPEFMKTLMSLHGRVMTTLS